MIFLYVSWAFSEQKGGLEDEDQDQDGRVRYIL